MSAVCNTNFKIVFTALATATYSEVQFVKQTYDTFCLRKN